MPVRWNGWRRAAATIGVFATISFPETPKPPKPPEPVPVSLYVWNAATSPAQITVEIDRAPVFAASVPSGEQVSRQEFARYLPGSHTVEAVVGGAHRQTATIVVDPQGNRWIIVTWWGTSCDVTLQHQPPWVKPAESS